MFAIFTNLSLITRTYKDALAFGSTKGVEKMSHENTQFSELLSLYLKYVLIHLAYLI